MACRTESRWVFNRPWRLHFRKQIGTAGNTIAGAIGGGVGGQILTALLPILSNAAGSVDVGTLLGQAVGGGVAGAVVTAVVGLIKNKMA